MSNSIETISGNIKYSESGLRVENYFIETSSTLLGLDTQYLTPDDLRKLADHLENMRNSKN